MLHSKDRRVCFQRGLSAQESAALIGRRKRWDDRTNKESYGAKTLFDAF